MRVLHVFDHSLPLHSGYSFRSRALIREQRRRGWETFHVTTPRHTLAGPDPESVGDELSFFRTPAPPAQRIFGLREIVEIRATAARIKSLLGDIKPDLIHAHSPALTAAAALLVRRETGIPVLYEIRAVWEDAAVANGTTTHGSLRYRATRAIETWAARRANAVACICQGLREEYILRGVDPAKIVVVPNAVDLEQFGQPLPRDHDLAKSLGLDDAEVVGFLGSFYDYEGLDQLIEALSLLRSTRPRLKALLVGGGPMEARIMAAAQRLGVSDRVVHVGRVPQADINKYYALVDVLAFPRRKSRLTDLVTPLKPLEAMALRKIVVASDVGGHREMISHGRTGYLFQADNVEALAGALAGAFDGQDEWPRIRAAGLDYVTSERTWARSVANYQPAYETMCALAGSAREVPGGAGR